MRKLTKTAVVVASMAVMAMGATVMAGAATEGWVQSGSNWYYYVDGDKVSNEWILAGDDWYFVDDEGKMAKNTFVRIDKYTDESEVLDDDDIYSDLGRDDIDDDSEFYYLGNDGKMVTGWKSFKASSIYASPNSSQASTIWYYFSPASGRMYVNEWVESNGQWYALSANGVMYAEAMVNNDLVNWDDDDSFYMDKNGAWVKGWYQTTKDSYAGSQPVEVDDNKVFPNDKKWVYGDPDDGVVADKEWLEIGGKYYFFGEIANNNNDKDEDLELKFVQRNDKNVELETFGKAKLPTAESNSSDTVTASAISATLDTATAKQSIIMQSDKFVQWTNHKGHIEYFYLTDSGAALTGWKEYDDDYYICANSNGELYYDEVALINGRYYYFDKFGVCDYKGLNSACDYVAVVEPTDKSDYDDEKHLTLVKGESTGSNVVIYKTSSKNTTVKAPYGDDIKLENEYTVSQMRTNLANGENSKNVKYEINGRNVAVSSMTDAEVVLVYTATQYASSADEEGHVDVDVYKLRTSSKISAEVSVAPVK